ALRDEAAAQQRGEEVVQRGEQHQRRAQAEPAVEILALLPESETEADDRQETQKGLRRQDAGEEQRSLSGVPWVERRECLVEGATTGPDQKQDDRRGDARVAEDALAPFAAPSGERRARDQHPREEPAKDCGPTLGTVDLP